MKRTPTLVQILIAVVGLSCSAASDDLQKAILAFPDINALRYRPDAAVRSANVLIQAGEDAACSALEQAATAETRPKGDVAIDEKACHLCRLLFKPAIAGKPLRPPALGASTGLPTYGMGESDWPLLPFAIVDGVPLSLNLGYGLAGWPEQAKNYLAYCRANGVFRTELFPKVNSATASNALFQVFSSPAWKSLRWKDQGPGWDYSLDEEYAKVRLWKQVDNMNESPQK